ncbi:hypothetical protein [Falsiroseomonas selenitidurans]|uniref:Uncharacterized protein n=1 Tax=Falsiroseomonas selenitidurans TaxID=2716335 RepID=A0ABX1E2T3_9PROT|nr:hypothetical protein [Falsiroseomonas selenitidurans]NKC31479.1 hypothetical protein [Falsiroseomonas selenitidurans]
MASPKQLREIFAPILVEHPDLVLRGRWLFRPPIETAIIGLYIGRTACAGSSDMELSVIPLSRFSPPSALGDRRGFEVERVIGVPPPGHWVRGEGEGPPRLLQDMFAPEYQTHLLRNFNAKVPPFLNSVREFADVLSWVSALRGSLFDSGPIDLIDGWLAAMRGDFATAADRLKAYIERTGTPSSPLGIQEHQRRGALLDALQTGDRSAIAAFLHEMEERTIAHHRLQRFWRRTPFPFENA